MKTLKTFFISTLTLFSSCLLLTGCGSSKEESKDATPQSAESASSSSEKDKTAPEDREASIYSPFNKNHPVYVTSRDDENMRVKAIVTPYLDTKDKVKVELYDTGDLQKTYIVNYKIKEIRKGSKDSLQLYRYSFYENDSDEVRNYDVSLMRATDLNDRYFLWIYPLDKGEKDLSDKAIRKAIHDRYGSLMTDEADVVTMK